MVMERLLPDLAMRRRGRQSDGRIMPSGLTQRSKSPSLPTLMTWSWRPRARAGSSRLFRLVLVFTGFAGFTSTAKLFAFGTSSYRSSSPFGPTATFNEVMPVTLPPGRLRPSTSPAAIGSRPVSKTIGILVVAAFAARAATPLPGVAMTVTFRWTRSAASARNRSKCSFRRRRKSKIRWSASWARPRCLRHASEKTRLGRYSCRGAGPSTARRCGCSAAAPPTCWR